MRLRVGLGPGLHIGTVDHAHFWELGGSHNRAVLYIASSLAIVYIMSEGETLLGHG